jgi:topoisomerase-4 subunit A
VLVTFTGKYAHREPEKIDAEEYIAKKGYSAKGKKCHALDLKKVEFIEPLVKPEDLEEEKPEAEPENLAGEIDMSDIIDATDDVDISDIDMSTISVPEVDDGEELTLF